MAKGCKEPMAEGSGGGTSCVTKDLGRPIDRLAAATNRLSPAVAVLDPVQVDGAEGDGGDAGGPVVVVFVDVEVEGGVAVHVGRGLAGPQRLLYRLVGQPLLQLGRAAHVVDDALRGNGAGVSNEEVSLC